MTRVMVTGGSGQLGRELARTVPPNVIHRSLSRAECDIRHLDAVLTAARSFTPEVIINTAAFTAVDPAELDPAQAYAINATGAANVARAACAVGARVVHISTDYVFGGDRSRPYLPTDEAKPVNVYGASKLEGENRLQEVHPRALIIRSSWIFSPTGKNFLSAILGLIRQKREIRVVDDQIGVPTSARQLARFIWWCVLGDHAPGIIHWVNSGLASRYDFAVEVRDLGREKGLVPSETVITPVPTSQYVVAATRPNYSVLDARASWGAAGEVAPHWRTALRDAFMEHWSAEGVSNRGSAARET